MERLPLYIDIHPGFRRALSSGQCFPAIGNEVPGLVNTIGAAKAGVCVPMKKDALMRAIRDIEENYDLYAKNAYDFYQGTDNEALMKRIIKENI